MCLGKGRQRSQRLKSEGGNGGTDHLKKPEKRDVSARLRETEMGTVTWNRCSNSPCLKKKRKLSSDRLFGVFMENLQEKWLSLVLK